MPKNSLTVGMAVMIERPLSMRASSARSISADSTVPASAAQVTR